VLDLYSKLRKAPLRAFALAFIAAALALSGAGGFAASAAAAEKQAYRIVAIGDSLTAGYQIGFTEKSTAYGYVERVYEQALFHGLRAEYVNYGVLGLQTPGLARWLSAAEQNKAIATEQVQSGLGQIDPRADSIFAQTPELRTALTKANLLVLTIGGNDMGAVLNRLPKDREATDAELAEAGALLQTALASYEQELTNSIQTAAKLAPGAEIVIADQYLPVPSPRMMLGELTELYPEKNRQFLLTGQKQMQEKLANVASQLNGQGINLKTANVAVPFAGYELEYTSIASGDIHPNQLGYAKMGEAFSAAIWQSYLTVQKREANVPISVVVNGTELISKFKPILVQNRTYVPLREITEALGATVTWDAKTQTATIKQDGRTVAITIGATTLAVNGAKVKLNAQPAFLQKVGKESKTYLPLAALSEGLEFQVVYRDSLKTAFINK
jgi:lysophospholipase L1-like esterase